MKKLVSLLTVCVILFGLLCVHIPAAYGAEFTGENRIVLVLDPGHGQADTTTTFNQTEAQYNLLVSKYIKEALDQNGSFVTYLTHEDNSTDPSLYERAIFADSVNADLIISIHFNSTENSETRGIEAWASVIDKFDLSSLAALCIDYATQALPELPVNGFNNGSETGVYRRKDNAGYYWDAEHQWDIQGDPTSGVLSDYYGIITWGAKYGIPAFILEEMYLSNEEDSVIAKQEENLQRIAQAEAQAIIDYYTGHTHDYGDTQTDVPLTCITAGKQSEHCTLCGHRKNVRSIANAPDPNAHFYRYSDAGESGTWTCVYTHSLINKAKIPHEDHSGTGERTGQVVNPVADNAVLPVPPFSEEPPASEDNEEQEQTAPEHNYRVTDGLQATYGAPGWATFVCTDCGDTYRVEFEHGKYNCKRDGHIPYPDDEFTNTEPTCTEPGVEHYFCLACWEEYTVELRAKGHTYETLSETPATCDKDGTRDVRCTVCGFTQTQTLSATGHDYVLTTVAPTCTENGFEQSVCSVCGDEIKKEIPATGHAYRITKSVEPGLLTAGKTVYTCSLCGNSYTETLKRLVPLPIIAVVVAVVLIILVCLGISIFGRRKSKNTPDPEKPENAPDPGEAEEPDDRRPNITDAPKIQLTLNQEAPTEQPIKLTLKQDAPTEQPISPAEEKPEQSTDAPAEDDELIILSTEPEKPTTNSEEDWNLSLSDLFRPE